MHVLAIVGLLILLYWVVAIGYVSTRRDWE